MIVRNWMNCPSSFSHGNIIVRTILTKEDPQAPGKEGAVLRHIESFSRTYLEPLVSSVPTAHENIQEVFYIVSGKGTVEVGDIKRGVREGDGILVPPGLTHSFVNEQEDEPLEMLILVEKAPEGAEVRKDPLIRNYRENPLGQGHWTHLVHPLFVRNDGLTMLHNVLIVRIEAMQTPDQHGHGENTDEIWYMLKGSGVHVMGRDVCVQKPGDAVACYPSALVHSLINHTEEPLQIFYFAHYE